MAALSKSLPGWIIPVVVGGAILVAHVWWAYRKKRAIKAQSVLDDDDDTTMIHVATVQHLWLYPVKSCHRVEVNETECLQRGLKNDRCWGITNKDGGMIDQAKVPKLATVIPAIQEDSPEGPTLILNAPNMDTLVIPITDTTDVAATTIKFYNMEGNTYDAGDEASDWISRVTGIDGCRIKYMSNDNNSRKCTDHYKYSELCNPNEETNFASFSPLFIASEASLAELNERLDSPVPMTRFRPNIVLTDCLPHSEGDWPKIKIGDCILRFITPGQRCIVTTIDQELGEKQDNEEPLKTLKTYRGYDKVTALHGNQYPGGPLFGASYSVVTPGNIKVGDRVYKCR